MPATTDQLDVVAAADLAAVVEPPSPKKFFTIVGVLLGALVALTLGLLWVRAVFFSPDAAVSGYVEALQDRDITAAISHLDMPEITVGDDLLQADALTNETYTPPQSIAVTSVTSVEDFATVLASVTWTTGNSTPVVFHLQRESAAPWRFFRPWRLIDGLDYISAEWQYAGGIGIAGEQFTGDVALPAFPGTYLVTPGTSALVEAPTVTTTVGAPAAGTVRFSPTIKASALADIQTQMTGYLDTCSTATTFAPPGCPFATYQSSFGNPTNIAWSITTTPTYVVAMNGLGSLDVTTTSYGSATVTWQTTDYANRTVPGTDSETFEVNGYATETAGKVTLVTTS